MNRSNPYAACVGAAERGSALMVAMILIFMMSIMGISVLRGSTLERRMATNAIQAREVSQLAESVTEQILNDTSNLSDAFVASSNADASARTVTTEKVIDASLGYQTRGELRYVGGGLAPGFSADLFEGLRYIASGTAAIASVGARSTIEQGAYQAVPAN